MKFKLKIIARYTAIMFNSANLRYRSMVQPKVQLTVVGITVTNAPSEEPYMVEVDGYTATRNVLYGATIEKFKDYVALQSYFNSADVIWLLTGKNMSRWENKKLIGNSGGFAYMAGVCTKWKVGMTEERYGSYYGVFVLAHELAHSLGCAHDGDKAGSWPAGHIGSADCSYDDGYMMSYRYKNPNMYKFSLCCQREVLNIYNRPQYECLIMKNSVKTSIFSSKLPGEVSSRTTYCKQVYSTFTYVEADKKYDMSRCIVKCYISRNGDNMLIGAVDGVHCATKKVCVLGNCTSKPEIDKAE
uniref:Reprolysin n=1 Tax=Rhipicephalus zambeziensis TaxID=60191 RepID=A0A224YQC3_9ACAR